MAAHVAHEVGSDAPLYETPLSVAPLEAVVVPTTDDGLQSQVRQRLQRGEVRTRHRCAGLFVDLNGEIGGYVLRSGRTVLTGGARYSNGAECASFANLRAQVRSPGLRAWEGVELG